uniref:Uncharacterized protein n=1 Tax=Glossina morsitans morsitans TaxID=37546 RepID=A0A1B0FAM5_GLOMM
MVVIPDTLLSELWQSYPELWGVGQGSINWLVHGSSLADELTKRTGRLITVKDVRKKCTRIRTSLRRLDKSEAIAYANLCTYVWYAHKLGLPNALHKMTSQMLSRGEVPILVLEEMPAEEEVPIPALEEVPIPALEDMPILVLEEMPIATLEEVPIPALEEMPIPALEDMPIPVLEEMPAEEEVPIPALEEMPVEEDLLGCSWPINVFNPKTEDPFDVVSLTCWRNESCVCAYFYVKQITLIL